LVSGQKELLRDPQGSLVAYSPPLHYELAPPAAQPDLAREPASWKWDGGKDSAATIVLRRESRLVERPGEKTRKRSTAEYAREFAASRKAEAGTSALERAKIQDQRTEIEFVAWGEALESKKLVHGRGFFASGDWVYVLEVEGESAAAPSEFVRERLRELSESFKIDRDDPRYLDPESWYTRQLDWTAPLRHNIFFSVGSSLLFALALFGLAVWKLKRIDF
jgi:hypothetical protein